MNSSNPDGNEFSQTEKMSSMSTVTMTAKPQSPVPSGTPVKVPRLVERQTGLRRPDIGSSRKPKNTVRKNTEDDLNEREPEIPYVKTELAIRDLVCSLMERQDRMNEQLFVQINNLEYRMDDLENPGQKIKSGEPGGNK